MGNRKSFFWPHQAEKGLWLCQKAILAEPSLSLPITEMVEKGTLNDNRDLDWYN